MAAGFRGVSLSVKVQLPLLLQSIQAYKREVSAVNVRGLLRWVGVVLAASVLSACATSGQSRMSLEERVEAYWAARAVGDYVSAYPFEAVSTQPDGSLQRYISTRGAIQYSNVKVLEVTKTADDAAEAKVAVSYRLPLPGMRKPVDAVVTSYWRLIEGQWYHSPRPGAM